MSLEIKLVRKAYGLGQLSVLRPDWPLVPWLNISRDGESTPVTPDTLDSLVYAERRCNFLVKINGARVVGDANCIVSPSGVVATDGLVFNPLNTNKIFGDVVPEKAESRGSYFVEYSSTEEFGEAVFIGGSWNYGHWLHNHLARLLLVPEHVWARTDSIVIPSTLSEGWRSLIPLVAGKQLRVIESRPGVLMTFRALWVPSMPWHTDGEKMLYTPHLIREMHDTLVSPTIPVGNKRVFITRANARWRRCRNEEALLEILRPYGFESYDMSALSIQEQLELGRQAECAVAPMGAGGNFHLFMPRGSALIELGPQADQMLFAPHTTSACDQSYKVILGERLQDGPLGVLDADYLIDPGVLVSTLISLGIREEELMA